MGFARSPFAERKGECAWWFCKSLARLDAVDFASMPDYVNDDFACGVVKGVKGAVVSDSQTEDAAQLPGECPVAHRFGVFA